MNTKHFDIVEYDNLGKDYMVSEANATKGKASKDNLQASFSWMTLNIILFGKLQDNEHITNVFAKGGMFHEKRMILSRVKAVAKELRLKGEVTLKTKKESFVYSLDQVEKANDMLFNVSTAFSSLTKEDKETTLSQDDKAIQAYLEISGTSKKAFNDMCQINPDLRQKAINEGLTLLDAIAKEEQKAAIPALCENIRTMFLDLKSKEDNTAYTLLQSLIGLYQDQSEEQKAA